MALAIFVPNLTGIHQPVLKLYQTAIHPALSPGPVYLAGENGKKFSRFWLHHVWSDVREKVWFCSFSLPFLLFCLVL